MLFIILFHYIRDVSVVACCFHVDPVRPQEVTGRNKLARNLKAPGLRMTFQLILSFYKFCTSFCHCEEMAPFTSHDHSEQYINLNLFITYIASVTIMIFSHSYILIIFYLKGICRLSSLALLSFSSLSQPEVADVVVSGLRHQGAASCCCLPSSINYY